MKFRYITPFIHEAFFTVVKRGIADAAKMLEVEVEFTGTEDADIEGLSRLILQSVTEGYNGIAVSLVDENGLAPAIEKAAEKGVPSVAFNIGGTGKAKVLSNICQDCYAAGVTVGETLSERYDGGSILFTLHDDVDVLRQRLNGALKGLDNKGVKPVYKVIVAGNDPEIACKSIQREMEKDSSITAVVGTGQSDTHGAGLANKRAKKHFYVAGFDVCGEILQMVKEGFVGFTIDQQPYVQGFYPLVQLYQNAVYGIMPSDIDAGKAVVNSSNIDQVLLAATQGTR